MPKSVIGVFIFVYVVKYVIEFFTATEIERFFENRIKRIVRHMVNEILIFFGITLVSFSYLRAFDLAFLVNVVFIVLVITFILIQIQLSNSKLQTVVNKYAKKVFGNLTKYKYTIFISNVLSFLVLYPLIITSTSYNIESTYNTGERSVFRIVSLAAENDPGVVLVFISFAILYFLIRFIFVPSLKLMEELRVIENKLDVVLSNGQTLNELYFIEFDQNHLLFSDDHRLSKSTNKYIVNKDKIDYLHINKTHSKITTKITC
ncbi:hypothetical protein [Dethiobacter alkaliphilus]|uniref:hypothetical protein n=1 Tax=Dethiobacter alkaliphilus TaxID=427926 RepID=UPI00222805FC|nr:hypothetical protein [Dethiobacter alkaliphilus]MCW3491333.1 hypothetical protein [Dethiobacter alkaliphilus]